MTEKIVKLGQAHTCCTCRTEIVKGAIALKRSRKAETYRERMHADRNGDAVWYHHTTCRAPEAGTLR